MLVDAGQPNVVHPAPPPGGVRDKCCDFWLRHGSCRNGDNCKFRHDPEKAGTNSSKASQLANKNQMEQAPAAKSQKVCDFFARMGSCRHGENCKFSHVKPVAGSKAANGQENGNWGNGDNQKGRTEQKPCDFWARTGSCKHGDACKFLHGNIPTGQNVAPNHRVPVSMAMQPQMMQMQIPMQGDMQAMQAYAQQAQEMANQYARQAQAFAQQAAEAQAAQMVQEPYQEQPYQEQPYQEQPYQEQPYFQPYQDPMAPVMQPQPPMQPEAGFIPYNDQMMDQMMDQFGQIALTPTRPYNGGMPSPYQCPQFTMTMPGAAEAAVNYAVAYNYTPNRRRRSPGYTSPRKLCDFFSRNGECRNGASCKFEHALLPESVEAFPPMPTASPPPVMSQALEMPGASSAAESKVSEEEDKAVR